MKVSFLDLKVNNQKFRSKILRKINNILLSGKILDGKDQKMFEKKISRFGKEKQILRI